MSSDKQYRVFLSYRDRSKGKEFAEKLFERLTEDECSEEYFGDVFYSPRCEPGGSFGWDRIKPIMKDVKYFVIPKTVGFFRDFPDENITNDNDAKKYDTDQNNRNKPNITPLEFYAALKNSKIQFIVIDIKKTKEEPEEEPEEQKKSKDPFTKGEMKALSKVDNPNSPGDYYRIVNSKTIQCYLDDTNSINDAIETVCERLLKKDLAQRSIRRAMESRDNNIRMTFREYDERDTDFGLFNRLYDVEHITFLNYACSSFMSGIKVAEAYKETDFMKRRFERRLGNGDISADIIITDPVSQAASDAADYKMRPLRSNIPTSEIIQTNMNDLFAFMKEHPKAKLNVYLTKIALPYGVMMTKHEDPKNNHIKVDLYAPVIDQDGQRPVFYVMERNIYEKAKTECIYSFFENNIARIKNDYSYSFNGHPSIEWLRNTKHIIHKGVLDNSSAPHEKQSIIKCIEEGLPIEIDLLNIDDLIIVGREKEKIKMGKEEKEIGLCTADELEKYGVKDNRSSLLTLDRFLDLVNGKVPVLLEIKIDYKEDDGQNGPLDKVQKKYLDEVAKTVTEYLMNAKAYMQGGENAGIAIHSSNPYALEYIKRKNCMIPCGIITADYLKIESAKGNHALVDAHNEMKYLDVFMPDFINCHVGDIRLGNKLRKKIAEMDGREEKEIPMLAWTIKNKTDQQKARICDNIVIEGAQTYI